jgi:phosphatidylinositol alpha-mannosyltransferase
VRIAIVTQPYYPQPGGVSEHVHHCALELRRLGHDVDIITSHFGGNGDDGEGVIRVGRNALVPHLGAFSNVNADPRLRRHVGRILRRNEYDVLHVHEPLSPTLPLVANHLAPLDTVLVGTFHASSDRALGYRVFRGLLSPYAARLEARVAVSRAAHRFVSRYFAGDYRIIPNGVDTDRFHPRNPPLPGLASARPTLLFVGRFYPRKGFPLLLDALPGITAAVPDVRLLVVGDGPLRSWYRTLARRAPCEVRFLGELSWEEIAGAYRTADVLVAPSTGQESFGIIHLEAMASGTPIVASDIEGYRETLDHEREALLFANRDADALARAVIRVLTDAELARTMGTRGRRKAEGYTWSRVVRDLESLFLGLVSRKQRLRLAS